MKHWPIRFFALALAFGMLTGCAKKEVVISSSGNQADETAKAAAGAGADEEAAEESAYVDEPKEEAAAEPDEMVPTDPVEVEGLSVSTSKLNDCKESGLYGLPSGTSIVYSVNGVINGTIQLQSSPPNELCFSCSMTLDAADTANVEMRVYENGELLLSGAYDVELKAGENKLIAFLKLPHNVSGSYRAEMWYNGQPAAAAEM